MKRTSFWLLCLLMGAAPTSWAEPNLLVGVWKLISWEATRVSNGDKRLPFGKSLDGRISYDAQGNMSAQVTQIHRQPFVTDFMGGARPDETQLAFHTYIAYYGKYSVDTTSGMVTDHVEGSLFPNWVGTKQERHFALDGSRLRLRTPPMAMNKGYKEVHILTWERVE
jgi:hypothetical protein